MSYESRFFAYAPDNEIQSRDYGFSRYGMEVQRLCSVLDNHLRKNLHCWGRIHHCRYCTCHPFPIECYLTCEHVNLSLYFGEVNELFVNVVASHLFWLPCAFAIHFVLTSCRSFILGGVFGSGYAHKSGVKLGDVLNTNQYTNIQAWGDRIGERPAVQRGVQVLVGGVPKPWLAK